MRNVRIDILLSTSEVMSRPSETVANLKIPFPWTCKDEKASIRDPDNVTSNVYTAYTHTLYVCMYKRLSVCMYVYTYIHVRMSVCMYVMPIQVFATEKLPTTDHWNKRIMTEQEQAVLW